MKNWKQTLKKVSTFVLALVMMVTMMSFPVHAEAAGETDEVVLYLKPYRTWTSGNFAVAYWFDENGTWSDGTVQAKRLMRVNKDDNIYMVSVPKNCAKLVFCTLYNAYDEEINGDNIKQTLSSTDFLHYDGTHNLFTVNQAVAATGGWSTYEPQHTSCVDDNEDGYCDNIMCKKIIDSIGAKLAGYTLSLDGNIGVNFYMELAEDVVADKDAFAYITYPNGNQKCYKEVYISDATKDEEKISGKTYYVFSCEVAAKDMTGEITLQMKTSKGEGAIYTYTVKDYIEYIIHNDSKYDATVVDLANAIAEYGARSQLYFDYNVDNLANEGLYDADQIWRVKDDVFESYVSSEDVANKSSAVGTFKIANLTLETTTTVNVLFQVEENVNVESLIFKVGDDVVEPVKQTVKGETYYRISKKNIKASDLEEKYVFSVSDGNATSTITYGAFSYANTILTDTTDKHSDEMKDVTRALWNLYKAAEAYVSANK